MTRVLAELLRAEQPRFNHLLQQLERASGRPSHDIRLTSELSQRLRTKISELGLDPSDTTSAELYHALLERFGNDEQHLRQHLRITPDTKPEETIKIIHRYAAKQIKQQQVLALKPAVARKLLKRNPPKRAMKQLSYRSLDSMLKHEAPAHIYAAAALFETKTWRKKFLDQYSQLQSTDFEVRDCIVSLPLSTRWQKIAAGVTEQYRHNVLYFQELGAIVLLPLQRDLPGLATINLLLVFHAANQIAATSSYLKLQQMKPGFGDAVRSAAGQSEPATDTKMIEWTVPWRIVHDYFARFSDKYNQVFFEPHVSPSDLQWRAPESFLAQLHPAFRFWEDTAYTAQLQKGARVSLNLLDVAISYCNRLPLLAHHTAQLEQHLQHELIVRYLSAAHIEQILGEQPAPEFAEID